MVVIVILIAQVPPSKTISVPATIKLNFGPGIISVCDPVSLVCDIRVDSAYVSTWVTAPITWPPASSWCVSSAQKAEDGMFEYGCHTVGDGTFKAYRGMIQLAP